MSTVVAALLSLSLILSVLGLIAMVWSILKPDRRIWPPQNYTRLTPIIVWGQTYTIFGAIIALGILGWGSAELPKSVRYGLAPLLLLCGNLAVWSEVFKFGLAQTGGAVGHLKVDGLYRYSRNPQYVADIAILVGWALLTASTVALPAILGGMLVLLAAPFAEEIWLEEQYGQAYIDYKASVRRYL